MDSRFESELDTPIYDMVRAGKHRPRRSMILGDRIVTLPVDRDIAATLARLNEQHTVKIAVALAPFNLHPFNLHPYDLSAPEYERIVYAPEEES